MFSDAVPVDQESATVLVLTGSRSASVKGELVRGGVMLGGWPCDRPRWFEIVLCGCGAGAEGIEDRVVERRGVLGRDEVASIRQEIDRQGVVNSSPDGDAGR